MLRRLSYCKVSYYTLELVKFLESIRHVFTTIVGSQELDLSARLVFNLPFSVLEYLQYFMLVVYRIHPRSSREVIHKGHKVFLSSKERILSWAPNIRVNIVKYVVSLMRTPCKFHTRLFFQYAILAEVYLEAFDPFEQSLADQTLQTPDS